MGTSEFALVFFITCILCFLQGVQPAVGWTTGAPSCGVERPGPEAKHHLHQAP